MFKQQYTSCMKVASGGNLGLNRKRLFRPMFYSWCNCPLTKSHFSQTLPVEQMGYQPLCMMQSYKILGSCRVPGEKIDSFVNFPPDKPDPPRHIIVSHNNHVSYLFDSPRHIIVSHNNHVSYLFDCQRHIIVAHNNRVFF